MAATRLSFAFLLALMCLHLVSPYPTDEDTRKRSRSRSSESGSSSSSSNGKKNIDIGGLFQLSDTHVDWWTYSQSFPVIIDAAFDEINNNPSILPDHTLRLVSRDTQGEGGLALFELFNLLQDKKKYPMIMGPTRSTVALATAQVMHHLNMVQTVFSTRSSSFIDRGVYPNVFMANFLNNAFNPAKIDIMDHFGWTDASTVTLNDNVHYSETADLHNDMRDAGYSLLSGTVLNLHDSDTAQSVTNAIANIQAMNPEVIFISTTVQVLATFMCEAYNQGLTADDSVTFVVTGPSMPDNWQQLYGDHTGCTVDQLKEASDGIYGVDHCYLREQGTSISGKTGADFTAWAQNLPLPSGASLPDHSPFAYDAAYAVALALDGAINAGVDIKHFDYDRADIGGAIKNQMQNVNFEGVTGPVSFNADGTRDGFIYVFQVDGNSNARQRLASYDHSTGQITWL